MYTCLETQLERKGGDMKDIINKIKSLGKKKEEVKKPLSAEEERRAVLAKEKEEASKKGEPWVGVLDTKVNPDNIKNGFFELDWNNEFIEQLLDAGYTGESNEEIVEQQTIDTEDLKIESEILLDQKLESKDVKILGLYDPSENGLSMQMWRNSNGNELKSIFASLDKIDLSKDANKIIEISLLTNANYPSKDISFEESIKKTGTYYASVKLHTEVTAKLKVEVVPS